MDLKKKQENNSRNAYNAQPAKTVTKDCRANFNGTMPNYRKSTTQQELSDAMKNPSIIKNNGAFITLNPNQESGVAPPIF